jgi:chromate transporter
MGILPRMALVFATLSLVAVGGANAVVPDLHRQVVTNLAWMDDRTFADLFGLAQVAPGPNILVVSLLGWQVAGLAGLLVATLAIVGPSSLVAFAAGRLVARHGEAPWLRLVQAGLVPVAVGLILASGLVMARAADLDATTGAITLATALFVLLTKRNPLWPIAGGAALAVLVRHLSG